jgi:hypothetical protein
VWLLLLLVLFGAPGLERRLEDAEAWAALKRFPNDDAIRIALKQNEAVDKFLAAYAVRKPWHKDEIEDLRRLNAHLKCVWDILQHVRNQRTAYWRNRLHQELGDDRFRRGVMPETCLYWLIPEID